MNIMTFASIPGSNNGLGVADSQADHLVDLHSSQGGGAPLALVETQRAALQSAPAAGHICSRQIKAACLVKDR